MYHRGFPAMSVALSGGTTKECDQRRIVWWSNPHFRDLESKGDEPWN